MSFNAIQHSFRDLQLLLNTCKMKCIIFNHSDLEYVDNYKYLGVWLDCKLSFQTHIKHLQQSLLHSFCQTYTCKTDYPTDPWLRRCHLQNSLQPPTHSKLDVVYHSAIRFVTKVPYTTQHCDLYAFNGWPSLHIRLQIHWLQVIYKSLLGKAPPCLSSVVTIATPTHSIRSSRYISLVIPILLRLSFQFSSANDWNELQKSLKLESYLPL